MHRRDQVAKHLNTQLNKYGEQNEYKLNFPTTKDFYTVSVEFGKEN